MSLGHGASIVRNGLVLYLDAANQKSYPGSGDSWLDISPSKKTATLNNEPIYSSGKFTFDGTNDYVSLPAPSPFAGTSLFTAEYWVNTTSITGNFGGIVKAAWLNAGGTGSGGGQAEFSIRSANNTTFTPYTIDFGRGGGGTTGTCSANVSSLMKNGSWYQIVLARTGTSSQVIYLNGSQIGTGNVSTSFNDGITLFGALAGFPSYSAYLNGSISIIKLYNRGLTAAEVLQNFNALRGRYGI